MIRVIVLLSLFGFLLAEKLYAQQTCQPTSTGSNSVEFDTVNKEYVFKVDGQTLYRYSINGEGDNYHTGATFAGLRAMSAYGLFFWPSYGGGLCAKFGDVIKYAWDGDVVFRKLMDTFLQPEMTVITRWRMVYGTDSIDYSYRFSIVGKTLVIQVEVENQSQNAATTGIDFARCEMVNGDISARFVRVPYLTLFNLLYCDGSYTSLFCDWEVTNASQFYPRNKRLSSTSVTFATPPVYLPKTDHRRNILKEKIYLTVSPDLVEVLPNVPDPTPDVAATRKTEAVNRSVLCYWPPFPWLLYPTKPSDPYFNGYTYRYLDSLKNLGVNDLNVIVKNYQYAGFDHQLPDILDPAGNCNGFRYWADGNCQHHRDAGRGGSTNLQKLRDLIVDTLQYGFALHEQYVDYFTTSPTYSLHGDHYEAKLSNGNSVTNFTNCDNQTSHVFKASIADTIATVWSAKLKDHFHPTWSYLDVHSAANPSDLVDYDASQEGAGMFKHVLKQYRKVASILRNTYQGPVQGEGQNHFLYAGYLDDFEARLRTGDESDSLRGQKAPLLVDFDLFKLHTKSAYHGVGHFNVFFDSNLINTNQMYELVATELAFGHGGLTTKSNIIEPSMEQAVVEYRQVLPVYKKIANIAPASILYFDGTRWSSASEYIGTHPGWDDINNASDFMSQVEVKYPNGITIVVNRHPSKPLNVSFPGRENNWHAYHANGLLATGKVSASSFTLPPVNGWVVCDSGETGDPDQPILISPLNGVSDSAKSVVLRWGVTPRATKYMIHVHKPNGDITATVPTTHYTLGDLPAGGTITWYVTASNDGGSSSPSAIWSFVKVSDLPPH